MKLKKILAVTAIALSVTSIVPTIANAVESKGDQKAAFKSIIKNGADGNKIVNNLSITANTKIRDYLTDEFIKEINSVIQLTSLGQGNNAVTVLGTDNLYDIQNKLLIKQREYKTESDKEQLYQDFKTIKQAVLDKLESIKGNSNDEIIKKVEKIVKYQKYGHALTVGTNSDNAKVISLEDRFGNIVLQVSSSELNQVIDKVESINNYNDLSDIFNKLKPLLGMN